MKYTWIFLILAFFFAYISSFLIRTQTPWNKGKLNEELAGEGIVSNEKAIDYIDETIELGLVWDYINIRSFLLLSITIGLVISCAFGSVHSFIDKLFFKKFYEEADWKLAFRRGSEISLLIFSLVILRLMAGLTIFTVIPVFLLFIIIEYYLTSVSISKEKKAV